MGDPFVYIRAINRRKSEKKAETKEENKANHKTEKGSGGKKSERNGRKARERRNGKKNEGNGRDTGKRDVRMRAEERKNGFIVRKAQLNIERTLCCGQTFRYTRQADGSYTVCSLDKRCRLYYEGDDTVAETDEREYFLRYFDLCTDYDAIVCALSEFEELHESLCVSGGLRILRQDPFETVVSFILSANNNIHRIRGMVERLCAAYGEKKDGWFAVPTRERLLGCTEEDFRGLGFGFRSGYLVRTLPMLTDDFLKRISVLPHAAAKKELTALCGVGNKVAECILLFGYAMTDVYPVDTWIFKAGRTDELDTPDRVSAYYATRYGKYAGYAQQYVFEYSRRKAATK